MDLDKISVITRPGGLRTTRVDDNRETWAVELTPTAARLLGNRARVGQLGPVFGFRYPHQLIEFVLCRATMIEVSRD